MLALGPAFALIAVVTPGAVHYASPDAGTTAVCDCVRELKQPGDECRLRAGYYIDYSYIYAS